MDAKKKYKIVFVVIPYSGHVNCMLGLAYELVHVKKAQVIFYGIKPHQDQIEKTGAEFREYCYYPLEWLTRKAETDEKESLMLQIIDRIIAVSHSILPQLMHMVYNDYPDLILYDSCTLFGLYLRQIVTKNHKLWSSFHMPLFATFSSIFAMKRGLFPTQDELLALEKIDTSWRYKLSMYWIKMKQLVLSVRFGIEFINPFQFAEADSTIPNLVATLPAVQPRVYHFLKSHKFVGFCINERFRPIVSSNSAVKSFLASFPAINPLSSPSARSPDQNRLIYVSLGTIFNNNVSVYERILEAIKLVNDSRFYYLISVGPEIYKHNLITVDEEFKDARVLLVPFAPQIEVLKRASLFISHSGLNSTSESIYNGVPLIALPIEADQPYNALRIEELKIGKRLNFKTFTVNQMADSIRELMNEKNELYMERVLKYARLSRRYDGSATAANFLIQYLNNKSN